MDKEREEFKAKADKLKEKKEKEKSKSEYRAYDFETESIDSWRNLGVQPSSFVQNDIEASIFNAKLGNVKF